MTKGQMHWRWYQSKYSCMDNCKVSIRGIGYFTEKLIRKRARKSLPVRTGVNRDHTHLHQIRILIVIPLSTFIRLYWENIIKSHSIRQPHRFSIPIENKNQVLTRWLQNVIDFERSLRVVTSWREMSSLVPQIVQLNFAIHSNQREA
jgi:hypothetical protein